MWEKMGELIQSVPVSLSKILVLARAQHATRSMTSKANFDFEFFYLSLTGLHI